jgi:tetratricopeptide (TPR) repeat protein
MNNLALVFSDAGKLDAALPLYEETLRLQKAKLGPDHPDTLTSMSNLGNGYADAGKLDSALPLYEETLRLRKAKLGPDHPDTLASMSNLATGYRDAGRLDAALPLFEAAASGIERRDYRNAYAGLFVSNTADCLERLRRYDSAEAWRRKWLTVVKERSGPTSPAYALVLAELGLNLIYQRKWIDAEKALRDALAIVEKQQPDAWTTFNTQSMLGDSLVGQKKYAEAEPLLIAGYEGMKVREAKIPTALKARMKVAVERLVSLYEATGKADEAAKWSKRLEEVKTAGSAPDPVKPAKP